MAPEDRYPQLQGKTSFRLLSLRQGHSNNDIVCHLQLADLAAQGSQADVVPYDALSYAFGADHPQYDITLGIWSATVRENLWHCLHEIGRSIEPTLFWIDALCINQSDSAERARQIQLMGQIYRRARRVVVWLGSADDDSVKAMAFIKHAGEDERQDIKRTQSDHCALLAWSERAYWTRTWVVQEFLLAHDIVLVCGSDILDWSTLERFLRRVERESLYLPDNLNDWSAFLRTPAFQLINRRAKDGNNQADLKSLLIQYSETICTYPQDKVYAMLGLATDYNSESPIRVSYDIDVRVLLFSVLVHCLFPAKDLLRWTRFLEHILEIASEKIWKTSMGRHMRDATALTISGFSTAEIVDCSSRDYNGTGPLDAESLSLIKGLCDDDSEDLPTMLETFMKDEVVRLKKAFSVIDAFRSKPLNAARSHLPRAVIVLAFTSGHLVKRVIPCFACGRLEKGDIVVQFLGNEIAITMDSRAGSLEITGCLLFPLLSKGTSNPARDMVTKMKHRSHIIQSEAECDKGVNRVSLHALGFSEVLALAH